MRELKATDWHRRAALWAYELVAFWFHFKLVRHSLVCLENAELPVLTLTMNIMDRSHDSCVIHVVLIRASTNKTIQCVRDQLEPHFTQRILLTTIYKRVILSGKELYY